MGNAYRRVRGECQRNFAKLIEGLTYRHSMWTVWQDFIIMAATSISNAVDPSHFERREKMYLECAGKYTEKELAVFPQLLTEVIAELDRNPKQDFLGELFMALELGNEWKGQFFTPYDVCRAMSAITFAEDTKERIQRQGWIGVSDPACGAGALLVAFANECHERHINYQTDVLFVAQDIDFIAGCMCYIQLSLLGCPGYVVIADSLLHPSTSYDKRGLIPCEDDKDVWYTPFFFRPEWQMRRLISSVELQFASVINAEPPASECNEMVEQPEKVAPSPNERAEESSSDYELNCTESGQLSLF